MSYRHGPMSSGFLESILSSENLRGPALNLPEVFTERLAATLFDVIFILSSCLSLNIIFLLEETKYLKLGYFPIQPVLGLLLGPQLNSFNKLSLYLARFPVTEPY